jgi:hypothetical protein
MRPGGRRQGLRFVPIGLALFLHGPLRVLTADACTSPSFAIVLLVRRTKIEDPMLQRDLPGYDA